MNAPFLTPGMAESETSEWAKNAAAFMNLAITERRLALNARRLAANAETADDARHYRAEARRLWDAAKWHVSQARDHHTLAQRKH